MTNRSPSTKLPMKPYRGTRDFYPRDMRIRNAVFGVMRHVAERFGYEEYDGPMLESFEVYAAKSGDELVNEQLYHFRDRGDRHVAIRPEMTPTVARMVAARIHELPRPIRWFSFPNLWRYEKPQRGRLREHWQFNVDILGTDAIEADQEIIEVAIGVMQAFGAASDDFKIHIANRRVLSDFLSRELELPTSAWGGVCRAIDKKAKITEAAFHEMLMEQGLTGEQIKSLGTYMSLTVDELRKHPLADTDGVQELITLFQGLDAAGLSDLCILDMSIVRGLDYYTGTVFEMYDQSPENRRALFGGGRYDNLVGLFSSERLSGVGFGMGDVTVQDFLETHNLMPKITPPVDVHVALFDTSMAADAADLGRRLRAAGFNVTVQLDPAKLGKQFKNADANKIPLVVLQGPDEKEHDTVQVKHLASREQQEVPVSEMVDFLRRWMQRSV